MTDLAAVASAVLQLEAGAFGFGAPLRPFLPLAPIALVAAFVEFEGADQGLHVVEARRAGLVEDLEVGGIDEVRHLDAVHREEELLDRVGDLVVVEPVGPGAGGVEVGERIDQHLGQLMRSGHAHRVLLLEDVLHEDTRHGQALGRDVVIALGGGVAAGVVKDHGPGAATEAARAHQLRRCRPDGREVPVEELLHSHDEGVEVGAQRGAGEVEAGDGRDRRGGWRAGHGCW